MGVAGIPCLFLGLCQGSAGAAVTDGHSGHKSDPYGCKCGPCGYYPGHDNVPVLMFFGLPNINIPGFEVDIPGTYRRWFLWAEAEATTVKKTGIYRKHNLCMSQWC